MGPDFDFWSGPGNRSAVVSAPWRRHARGGRPFHLVLGLNMLNAPVPGNQPAEPSRQGRQTRNRDSFLAFVICCSATKGGRSGLFKHDIPQERGMFARSITACRAAPGKGICMDFRTVMQAGPAKANELFAKLADTSDGAVKTREKLFTELKAELELHTSLEEQHLFPILRRNAETKELVADAIKDNKELRAKLTELEALPKNDEAFPERLKELQKTFRQHARDEKRELLPAVKRALSQEQMQGVTEKIEAAAAEAEQARQDEAEERRLKARQERERAEHQAERQAEAERAKQAAAEQARHEEAERRVHELGDAVAQTAMAAPTNVLHIAKGAAATAQRVGAEIQGVADTNVDAVKSMVPVPDLPTVASVPEAAVTAMSEIRSAWLEWMGHTTRAGAQTSQELLWHAAEQHRRFATDVMQGWMEHNARIMDITVRVARESFRPIINLSASSTDRR
jgi:hypothetical protein